MTFRDRIRKLKAKAILKKPCKPPIIIVASRRGGSTMLADVIACNRGIWFANEPFAVLPAHPEFDLKRQLLPEREHSQYFDLTGEELELFDSYVKSLLQADLSSLGTCRRVKFPFTADRVCLKILNAPWMLEWFLKETNGNILFLTRHPAAQALSVIRQGWDFGVRAYFNRPHTLEAWFTSDQISAGLEILQRNNIWEVAILDWIVSNRPGLESKDDSLIRVSYEDLVVNPNPFTKEVLENQLGLTEFNRMARIFNSPSNSSSMSTSDIRQAIIANDKKKLLSQWMQHVTPEDSEKAQSILDRFNIKNYAMRESMPIINL